MNLWHLKTGSTPALPILQRTGGGITAGGGDLTDLSNLAAYTQGEMADPINVVDDFLMDYKSAEFKERCSTDSSS